MEERIVIVGYKPKAGQKEALQQLMREHLAVLKSENLVTGRDSIMMEAADGTIIEVFEWKSAAAVQQAHTNPVVLKMWEKYTAACDYIPVAQVAEASALFSSFMPFK
jgi:quinol monooxygenase YgiN